MNIEQQLSRSVMAAVKALYGQEIPEKTAQVQQTRSEFEGNLTLVVFPFLKISKKKPEDTAQEIGDWLLEHEPAIERFNVVKGFLNMTIARKAWVELLNSIDDDATFGCKKATDESPLVMIEYSSPNTNKPLHLGHVRNNLLGWSLAQIMEANGNRVVKTNIVNDRGIHICKSMLAWQKWGNGETPETSGKKGDHLIGDYYVAFDKHYREEVAALQQQLKSYVSKGGNLMVSGAYLGSDMTTDTERAFLKDVLKVRFEETNNDLNEGVSGMGMAFNFYRLLNEQHYAATHTDILMPDNEKAFPAMVYHNGTSAAVAYKGGDYNAFVMGFPFECIKEKEAKASIMRGILNFLTTK